MSGDKTQEIRTLPQRTVLTCHYCIFETFEEEDITEENAQQMDYITVCCGTAVCLYHVEKGFHAHIASPIRVIST